jgi:hypothetical protein
LPGKNHFLKPFVHTIKKKRRKIESKDGRDASLPLFSFPFLLFPSSSFLFVGSLCWSLSEENFGICQIFFDTYSLGQIKDFFEGTKNLAGKRPNNEPLAIKENINGN